MMNPSSNDLLKPGKAAVRGWLLGAAIALVSTALVLAMGAPPLQGAQEGSVPASQGELAVVVTDAETGEPLSGVTVRLRSVGHGGITGRDGRANLEGLSARSYIIRAERLGYAPVETEVEVREGEVAEVALQMVRTPIELGGLVVTGTGRERGVGEVYRPTTSLSGTELQRSLSSNVPETLRSVPGFAVQYNGPGAASPSIRGMSGDRVLMLEDGHRTGDLYSTGSDHGVMVEPISAQRMEVVRGPAGLLYGSNALGGVVNVIRDDVPRRRPSTFTGTASTQFESVNSGVGGGVVASAPVGPLALRVEGTARRAGDTRTPAGTMERTDMEVYNLAAGASWVPGWGFVGAAVRFYDNVYGVPGEFDGELIPGGHPGGVDIEARRTTARFRAAYLEPFLGFFDSAELDGSVTNYIHDEIEGLIGGETVTGACFDQTSVDVNLIARHDHTLHEHNGTALRAEGAYGGSFQSRDLWAGCNSPGTRSADEWSVAVFGYEEFGFEPFRLQVGARFDHKRITPASTDSIRVRTQERRITKPVMARDFSAFSGSVATLWDFSPGWTLGASLARSFRNPAIEELYSDGPHLADFSFDIGSPDLDSEVGTGVDVFLRSARPDLSVEMAAYFNRVSGFIYYLQTGETVRVIREGAEPRVTPVFEARGDDAEFMGVEGRIQWEALRDVVVDVTASYTRAQRIEDSDPLPFIPPLNGSFDLRYEGQPLFGSMGIDFSGSQERVPRPVQIGDLSELPQEPTSGYGVVNAGLGWRHDAGGLSHTVTLQANNLMDRSYRDHLSRIKDIAPQPGRNLQLTYRVHF
jgi:iron complex outermembrane recepter protein